jgi:hypothetical protein
VSGSANGGAENAGAGGAAQAGDGGTGTGTSGEGGGGLGGANASGAGGLGESGGAGGAPAATECAGATLVQTAGPGSHDHIPDNPTTLFTSLTNLINGSNPTATFALPLENGHSHDIVLTASEVTTLLAGGTVTGKISSETGNHQHTYTISCG